MHRGPAHSPVRFTDRISTIRRSAARLDGGRRTRARIVTQTCRKDTAQHMNEEDSPYVNTVVTVDIANCLAKARDAADTQLNAAYSGFA